MCSVDIVIDEIEDCVKGIVSVIRHSQEEHGFKSFRTTALIKDDFLISIDDQTRSRPTASLTIKGVTVGTGDLKNLERIAKILVEGRNTLIDMRHPPSLIIPGER